MNELAAAVRPEDKIPAWRKAVPWWTRIAGKLVLSRLPIGGAAWQKIGIFSSCSMLDLDYVITTFRQHFTRAGSPAAGFTYLELGPGDSLANAAVAWAHGAAGGWLVDAGAYATRDIAAYQPVFRRLAALRDDLGLRRDTPELQGLKSFDELLSMTKATYREDGLAGLRAIPSDSIDFAFSQVTMEHVLRGEFTATQHELHRLLKPGGRASHEIDFKDHLGGSLHNLRFDDAVWEKRWFALRSGFYTNRLRLSEMLAAMTGAGLAVDVLETRRWPAPPLPRQQMAAQFRGLSDEDLVTSEAIVVASKHG